MTVPLLLEHFDELISTPDDVGKLNNSILQLAMQGKLVEQENGNWNENDVKLTLANEIQSFIAAGKINKPSKILPISISDIPADKPNNWLCMRLGECLGLVNGRAYKQSELLDSGTPVIRIQNLNGGDRWYYSDLELPPEKYCDTNDLLFAWSASFGPYIWEGTRAIFHYHIWKIELTSYVNKRYAYFLLMYLTEQVRNASHGLAMLHITKEKMENWVIVLPPISEQVRIVARLDELFAQTRLLTEQLVHSRTEHDRLNESALAHLLAFETPDEFNERWSFIGEHFDLLTSAPEHVAPLRQSILELAVHGKLTQRKAEDEPAKELLKRIRVDKEKALQDGELRYVKEHKDSPDEPPFEIPLEWVWCKAQDLFFVQSGNAFKSQHFTTRGIRLARNVNIGHGSLTWKDVVFLAEEQENEYDKFRLSEGDILISLDRPLITTGLKVAQVAASDLPCLLVQRVGRVIFWSKYINPKYVYLWFLSSLFVDSIDPGRSKGIPHISQNDITKLPLPLPSLSEQERIVKRVEQLLGWCDALEAQLKSAEEERGRLVRAVMAGVGR